MTPATFPEVNCKFGPPEDFQESQVHTIEAFRGAVATGSCEGAPCVVVAYRLTKEEAAVLADGHPLYFTMLGGLAPHYPSLSFHDATNPA